MAKLKPFFKDIFFQSAWMILLRKSGTVTGEKPHSDFIPQKDGEVKPAPAPVGTAHVFFLVFGGLSVGRTEGEGSSLASLNEVSEL